MGFTEIIIDDETVSALGNCKHCKRRMQVDAYDGVVFTRGGKEDCKGCIEQDLEAEAFQAWAVGEDNGAEDAYDTTVIDTVRLRGTGTVKLQREDR